MRLLHELIVNSARLIECFIETSRDPRIAFEGLLFDYDWMHDGKDAGLLVIVSLFSLEIGEKTLDSSSSTQPPLGQIRLQVCSMAPLYAPYTTKDAPWSCGKQPPGPSPEPGPGIEVIKQKPGAGWPYFSSMWRSILPSRPPARRLISSVRSDTA